MQEAINTRHAWRPLLRPIGRLLIAAQLALILQPLSVLAPDRGAGTYNPAAQAQLKRYAQLSQTLQQTRAAKAREQQSAADQTSDKLKQAQGAGRAAQERASQRQQGGQAPATEGLAGGCSIRHGRRASRIRWHSDRSAEKEPAR